jgi:hypothetical protein
MSLKKAFGKLSESLQDLSSLETRTYRGDITAEILNAGSEADFKKLLDKARTKGTLKLILYTRMDGDGDSDHIYSNDAIDQGVIDAHKSAFDMGREIRQGYLELFKDIASDII